MKSIYYLLVYFAWVAVVSTKQAKVFVEITDLDGTSQEALNRVEDFLNVLQQNWPLQIKFERMEENADYLTAADQNTTADANPSKKRRKIEYSYEGAIEMDVA